MVKKWCFAIFLKNGSNDFAYIAYIVRGDDSWSSCKNCIYPKKNWFSSYSPKCLSANQIARFLKIEYLKNRLSVWVDFLLGNSESWKEHNNMVLWLGHIGGMPGHAHPCPHSDPWGLTLQKKLRKSILFCSIFQIKWKFGEKWPENWAKYTKIKVFKLPDHDNEIANLALCWVVRLVGSWVRCLTVRPQHW